MQDLNYEVIIPELGHRPEQDEECVIVDFGDRQEKMRLHDYAAIYKIPGLYEEILCNRLKCRSPEVLCDMLSAELELSGESVRDLRVLDVGAGNGVVGEELKKRQCGSVVGVDILTEAKDAAERDRAGVYADYHVMDLGQFHAEEVDRLREYDFTALITVGALGFDDMPTRAFLNAFNLIQDGGWIVFNIKERFLANEDGTGYRRTIEAISQDSLSVRQRKRYCHRLSLWGEDLYYMGIVGRKTRNVDLSELR